MTANRRALSLVLAVAFVSSTAGCGGDESGDGSAVRIGMVAATATDPWYRDIRVGAEEQAEKMGVELEWSAPTGAYDAKKYLDAIDDMATSGVKAMAMDPFDAELFGPTLDRIVAEGLPVVNYGNPPVGQESASINTDTEGAVAAGMKSMIEDMGGEGAVGLLEMPGNVVVSRRIELATEALEAAGIEVVASGAMDCTRVKGADATQDMLQAHPEITGLFAGCGLPGVGAAQAAEQAGRDIVIYSYDGGVDELRAIEAGTLTGAIKQRPFEIGATTVETLVKLAQGEPVEEEYPMGFDIVTRENVARFEQE